MVPLSLVGQSDEILTCLQKARHLAKLPIPVLVSGEIGTGKRDLAKLICQLRSDGVCWNLMAGTSDELALIRVRSILDPEFHSPVSSDPGLTHPVGNLVIQHVELLSAESQLLLNEILALIDGTDPHPATTTASASLKIVATTSSDLRQQVLEHQFREDLYWSLSRVSIELPPLRHRMEDLEPLIQKIWEVYGSGEHHGSLLIDPDVRDEFKDYGWPGNIRELIHCLVGCFVHLEGKTITRSMLPATIRGESLAAQTAIFNPTDETSLIREFVNHRILKSDEHQDDLFKQIVEPVERELIQQVMELCNQTQTKAATRLGINRNTLYKKLVEYGLNKTNDKDESDD